MKNFREKLIFLRREYKMTQKQITERLPLDRSSYVYYETGRSLPKPETIVALAEIYNVSLDYLMLDQISIYEYRKHPFYA